MIAEFYIEDTLENQAMKALALNDFLGSDEVTNDVNSFNFSTN